MGEVSLTFKFYYLFKRHIVNVYKQNGFTQLCINQDYFILFRLLTNVEEILKTIESNPDIVFEAKADENVEVII